MKTLKYSFVVLVAAAFALTSCGRCESCTVFDGNGEVYHDYPEQCTNEDRDAMRASASLQADLLGGSFVCD